MKRNEIQNCAICKQGLMHDGSLNFYKVRVQMLCFIPRAIERAHGLEVLMGSPFLANVMGPNEDLAKEIGEYGTVLVCASCSTKPDKMVAYFAELCKVEKDDDLTERARVEEQEADRHEAERSHEKDPR